MARMVRERRCDMPWRDRRQREKPMRTLVHVAVAAALSTTAAVAAPADEASTMPSSRAATLLDVMADGVQIYACEATERGLEWVFKAPEANLFDTSGRQVGIHFGGPTWKLQDGSLVVGEVVSRSDAPRAGAIPWLLLRAKSHGGGGVLSAVTHVRRTNTQGGVAPRDGCDPRHVSEEARMRYSATYEFFATPE
jgi:hypothetical protein